MQQAFTKAASDPVDGSKSIISLMPFNTVHLETTTSKATNEYEPATTTVGLQMTNQGFDSHSSKSVESYGKENWKCNGTVCTKAEGSTIDDTTKSDELLLNKLKETLGEG